MKKFKGAPYPIVSHPRGLLHIQSEMEQIKADLLQLLQTNPQERVMLLDFGTPLKNLLFNPNDETTQNEAREMIINSIRKYEPRVSIEAIDVGFIKESDLDLNDTFEDIEHILHIKISFLDPENIQEIQALELKIPIGG